MSDGVCITIQVNGNAKPLETGQIQVRGMLTAGQNDLRSTSNLRQTDAINTSPKPVDKGHKSDVLLYLVVGIFLTPLG